MQEGNAVRVFLALWWTLAILLVAYSARTAWLALTAPGGIDVHLAILASAEAIAAILFVVPRTMRTGGVGLLAIFALALVLHGSKGEFEGQLLIYAVAVGLVLVHRSLPRGASSDRAAQSISGAPPGC
jgi:hypothetical protein